MGITCLLSCKRFGESISGSSRAFRLRKLHVHPTAKVKAVPSTLPHNYILKYERHKWTLVRKHLFMPKLDLSLLYQANFLILR